MDVDKDRSLEWDEVWPAMEDTFKTTKHKIYFKVKKMKKSKKDSSSSSDEYEVMKLDDFKHKCKKIFDKYKKKDDKIHSEKEGKFAFKVAVIIEFNQKNFRWSVKELATELTRKIMSMDIDKGSHSKHSHRHA
jgi:F0F1-type ATP synthase membrane subunit b/b'